MQSIWHRLPLVSITEWPTLDVPSDLKQKRNPHAWNNGFETVGRGQHKRVISGRWETKEVNFELSQLTALREFPGFRICSTGLGDLNKAFHVFWIEKKELSIQGGQEFAGESNRDEKAGGGVGGRERKVTGKIDWF